MTHFGYLDIAAFLPNPCIPFIRFVIKTTFSLVSLILSILYPAKKFLYLINLASLKLSKYSISLFNKISGG